MTNGRPEEGAPCLHPFRLFNPSMTISFPVSLLCLLLVFIAVDLLGFVGVYIEASPCHVIEARLLNEVGRTENVFITVTLGVEQPQAHRDTHFSASLQTTRSCHFFWILAILAACESRRSLD